MATSKFRVQRYFGTAADTPIVGKRVHIFEYKSRVPADYSLTLEGPLLRDQPIVTDADGLVDVYVHAKACTIVVYDAGKEEYVENYDPVAVTTGTIVIADPPA